MRYVDGFLLPVPKKNLRAYTAMAKKASRVWKSHGALDYVEAAGDDLKPAWGTPFPKLMKAKAGETLVFSYIVYRSRAHRDAVNKKVMADPRLNALVPQGEKMPFDMKRMCYGGFRVIVQA
jgi:uncharacterized protein YbaA (DUF1428 family)